jgi:hypothetical protein
MNMAIPGSKLMALNELPAELALMHVSMVPESIATIPKSFLKTSKKVRRYQSYLLLLLWQIITTNTKRFLVALKPLE